MLNVGKCLFVGGQNEKALLIVLVLVLLLNLAGCQQTSTGTDSGQADSNKLNDRKTSFDI